jgi:hypothetical protein
VRSLQWQHHVGAVADTPTAKGLAEVFIVLFHTQIAGDIEQPEDTDGAIDCDAAKVARCVARLALQKVIYRDEDISNVGEDILNASAHGHRYGSLVTLCGRLDQNLVYALIDGKHGPIETFDRILWVSRSRTAAEHGSAGDDRHHQGNACSSVVIHSRPSYSWPAMRWASHFLVFSSDALLNMN